MKLAAVMILLLLSIIPLKAKPASEPRFDGKCGTFRLLEERRQAEIAGLPTILSERPENTHNYISPSGKFKIHYDREGKNKVEAIDKNQNGVPDYVDSVAYYFDYVYNVMVNEMGFHSPYPDGNGGGSEHYDVYLQDIGNGLDGEVYYGSTSSADEILPKKVFSRYYSYIIMDNDYSPNDMTIYPDKVLPSYSTTGVAGMKVTVAHEFHHAIQFMYGNPGTGVFSINEMVSVYMENRMFPESLDFMQYIRQLYKQFPKYPFGSGIAQVGYPWGIYFHFVDKFYGEATIKRMYEIIESGQSEYEALDSALKEKGTSISESWNELMSWLYHTGKRTIEGYSFYLAHKFPEIKFTHEGEISPDESFNIAGQILPFEIRPIRYIVSTGEKFDTPDTLDFLISNADVSLVFSQFINVANFELKYPNNSVGSKPICDGSYLLTVDHYYKDTTFCKKGYRTVATEKPFPSPFDYSKDKLLYLPTPKDLQFGVKVFVQIFNLEMVELWSGEKSVMVHNSKRVAPVELDDKTIGSGIYIYKVTYDNKSELGKFAVKR